MHSSRANLGAMMVAWLTVLGSFTSTQSTCDMFTLKGIGVPKNCHATDSSQIHTGCQVLSV